MNSCRYLRGVSIILVKILMEHEILDRFFEECSNIKFHENPSNGTLVFKWG